MGLQALALLWVTVLLWARLPGHLALPLIMPHAGRAVGAVSVEVGRTSDSSGTFESGQAECASQLDSLKGQLRDQEAAHASAETRWRGKVASLEAEIVRLWRHLQRLSVRRVLPGSLGRLLI